MGQVFHGLTFAFSHIDYVLIAITDEQEHFKRLRFIFQSLQRYVTSVDSTECILGAPPIVYFEQ